MESEEEEEEEEERGNVYSASATSKMSEIDAGAAPPTAEKKAELSLWHNIPLLRKCRNLLIKRINGAGG